jgi:hypothetical protein
MWNSYDPNRTNVKKKKVMQLTKIVEVFVQKWFWAFLEGSSPNQSRNFWSKISE